MTNTEKAFKVLLKEYRAINDIEKGCPIVRDDFIEFIDETIGLHPGILSL